MTAKKSQLQLKYKFWIETGDHINLLGEGKWLLLKAIRDKGSLKAAVDEMGYAYRQTWDNLKKIEKRLGFKLIEKTRGGAAGGHTALTEKGLLLVDFFEKLYNKVDPAIQQQIDGLQNELNALFFK
jgi:molybdate transport system regulatory protein